MKASVTLILISILFWGCSPSNKPQTPAVSIENLAKYGKEDAIKALQLGEQTTNIISQIKLGSNNREELIQQASELMKKVKDSQSQLAKGDVGSDVITNYLNGLESQLQESISTVK